MKYTLSLLMIVCFVFSCKQEGSYNTKKDDGSKAKAKTEKPIAKKEVDGKAVYKLYCLTCHGPEGNMGGSGAFDLTTTKLNTEEKIEIITKGRNTMTPYDGILSKEEIIAVAKYTDQLQAAAQKTEE